MKQILAFAVAILLFVAATASTKLAAAMPLDTQPPAFTVKAGESVIPSRMGISAWDGAVVKREDTLADLAKANGDFPYVPLGTEIIFTMDGQTPDSMRLLDYVLNEDGTEKYPADGSQNEIAFSFEEGAGSFELPGNFRTLLSSDSGDYAPGKSLRGFKLICAWGENACEYAFILRSDAGLLSEETAEPMIREETIQLEGMDETITTTYFESPLGYSLWLDLAFLTPMPKTEDSAVDEFGRINLDDPRYGMSVSYADAPEYSFSSACESAKQAMIERYGSVKERDTEGLFTGQASSGFYAMDGGMHTVQYVVDGGNGAFYIQVTYPPEAAEGFGSRVTQMLKSFDIWSVG